MNLDRMLNVILVAAAVVTAGTVIRREFGSQQPQEAAAPKFIPDWKSVLGKGHRVGDSTAAVTIVELTDLECPACRGFQPTIDSVLAAHPRDVAIVYVPYPLSSHRFALPAARAAECAAQSGQFARWMAAVFAKQDSLGLKSWGSFASEAGIEDTARFARCAVDRAPQPSIEAGLAYGRQIRLQGTPTILVNGYKFADTPIGGQLEEAVQAILSHKVPFKS